MTKFSAPVSGDDRLSSATGVFDWKGASKASICTFMLAFAPLGASLAQTAAAAPAPAAAAPAAAAPAAATAAAPAAASASSASASPVDLGNMTVTGSALSRTDTATALPVTTVTKDELVAQGITSTEEVLDQLPSNSSSYGAGLGTGAAITGGANFAALRGLDPEFTLILLNGKRLPVEPFNGGTAVDLNLIPFAAVERVEVLRDGASALYGADAVAGVINFITDRNLEGGKVVTQYSLPTRHGGGNSKYLTATLGQGDLEEDRYNILATVSYRRQDEVNINNRGDFVVTRDLANGVDQTSSFPNPGSYYQGGSALYNPAAPNCGGGYLFPDGNDNCRFNFQKYGNVVTPTNEISFYTDGTYKISDRHEVSLSYLYSNNESTGTSAPGLTSDGVQLSPSSPFYPGSAGGPAVPASFADFDPTEPVTLLYRNRALGPRITHNENRYHHVNLEFDGRLLDKLRYKTSVTFNQAETELSYEGGYFNPNALGALFNNGTVDPFLSAEELSDGQRNAVRDTQHNGQISFSRSREYTWNGQLSRQVGDWFGAGQAALAVGAQYRHQTLENERNNDLITEIAGSGGGLSATDPLSEDRDIGSIYSELNIPLLDSLEVTGSFRYDNYDDVGDTVNPKVSLRYQPIKQVVLRGSYTEGFAAPSLSTLYEPASSTFTSSLNDPRYCDGDGNPTAGAPANSCNYQFMAQNGGNANLEPQTSKSWTAGVIVSPIDRMSLGVDFWWIELKNQISALSASYVLANAGQFSSNIVRDPDTDAIDLIRTPYANLGSTYTNGVDFSFDYSLPVGELGTFALQFEGTLTNKYAFQSVPDGEYQSAKGTYQSSIGNGIVVPDWKHTIRLSWARGPWSAALTNNFMSGYTDYDPSTHAEVNDYSTFDVSTGYAFDNGIKLRVGSQNVFDKDPVFSNQSDIGYGGYDARYTDALGRTVFGRLSYEF